jgi:GT2 family glycosyltransferase
MNYVEAVAQLVCPDDLCILIIGPGDDFETRFAGREIWRLQSGPVSQGIRGILRAISGRLLNLPLGTLPRHSFDLIVVTGDLPFGSDLIPFLVRLRELSGRKGRIVARVPNSMSADRISAQLNGGFDLDPDGSFTPVQFRCALAEAGLRLVAEMTAEAVPLDGFKDPLFSTAETTFVAAHAGVVTAKSPQLASATPGVRTSIIVLTYNSASTIEACLTSVLAGIGPTDEVLVVDNASQDKTCDLVKSLGGENPQIRIIQNESNLGFSAGCNVGILASQGAFVAHLNPDTIVWPGWIESLLAPLADPTVGLVGPLSDRIAAAQFVGQYLFEGSPKSLEEIAASCRSEFRGQYVGTKLLIGLCLMTRRDVFQEAGLLDEDLFLGSDDLELSWRVRTRDFKLLISKETFVHHLGGVSFSSLEKPEKARLLFESTEALLAKVRAYYGWNPPDRLLWGIDITHR